MVIQSFYVDTMCILVRVQRLLASISPCAQTRMAQDLTYRGSISCSSNIPNPKVHRDPKKGMFSQDLRKVSKPHLVPWPPWLSSWQPSEAPPDPRFWDHLEAGDGARAAATPWRHGEAAEAVAISAAERQREAAQWQRWEQEEAERRAERQRQREEFQ